MDVGDVVAGEEDTVVTVPCQGRMARRSPQKALGTRHSLPLKAT